MKSDTSKFIEPDFTEPSKTTFAKKSPKSSPRPESLISKIHSFEPWKRKNQLVAIEGVIGVGKTTLVRRLARKWACPGHFEQFEDNPFLIRGFYDDQKQYGFNTELFFLLTRFRQQEQIQNMKGLNLVDYVFEKNKIFADLNLKGVDKKIYDLTYKNFSDQVRKPDLVVLLEADLESLLRRIYNRDREFERNLSPAYLEKLMNAYNDFFLNFNETPVLRIQTSGLDFVQDDSDFELIASRIEERLTGLIQLPLVHEHESRLAAKN